MYKKLYTMTKGDLFQIHRASSRCENPSMYYTINVIFKPSKTKEKNSMTIAIHAGEKHFTRCKNLNYVNLSAKQE